MSRLGIAWLITPGSRCSAFRYGQMLVGVGNFLRSKEDACLSHQHREAGDSPLQSRDQSRKGAVAQVYLRAHCRLPGCLSAPKDLETPQPSTRLRLSHASIFPHPPWRHVRAAQAARASVLVGWAPVGGGGGGWVGGGVAGKVFPAPG